MIIGMVSYICFVSIDVIFFFSIVLGFVNSNYVLFLYLVFRYFLLFNLYCVMVCVIVVVVFVCYYVFFMSFLSSFLYVSVFNVLVNLLGILVRGFEEM